MSLILSVVTVVLTVLALIDVVRQPDNVIKNLPKIVWILLIVFIPLIGVTLWFILGHDWKRGDDDGGSFVPRGRRTVSPQRVEPYRPPQRSTEEQLADLEREEEHYRRLAEQQRRERERPQDSTTDE